MPRKVDLELQKKRSHKRKVFKRKVNTCKHTEGWAFIKIDDGVRRTCNKCSLSIKDVGKSLHIFYTRADNG